jgi:NADPH:quinone reductase-like Zn-dependent oxidoreductase
MKAIVQERYGSPDVLRLADIDPPVAGPGELLIRVRAASVNAADWHIMRGDPYLARLMEPSLPLFGGPRHRIRGRDFAGVVEATGPGVVGLARGDEVYGDLDADGTFAEFVCAPADLVERKPANLSFEQAAAMPLAGCTALAALRDAAQVQPGQRVLINGASGGVGTFAVQIAKVLGADVTGVCSTRNTGLVQALGADQVIDYTTQDVTLSGGQYDVVLDLVGNHSLAALRRVLTTTGTLILSGGGVSRGGSVVGPMGLIIRGMILSRFVSQRLIVLITKPSREHLAALRDLAEAGKITPAIERTYPLSQAPDAIRHLEQRHASAKIVISV